MGIVLLEVQSPQIDYRRHSICTATDAEDTKVGNSVAVQK